MKNNEIYQQIKQKYTEQGVDTEKALKTLQEIPISVHCWQTDNVTGLEQDTTKGGGILATGTYLGKARNVQEIWTDLEKVLSITPGTKRINIHAMYGDYRIDRDQIQPEHFQNWIYWAKKNNVELDFNSTMFAHPKAEKGFTLSSKDKKTRRFWIEHVKRCREIADYIGKNQHTPCFHNLWIPDGMKDITIDRMGYRNHLRESLDEIYSEYYTHIKDNLESKLFGLASESYVVGSHDFYLGYSVQHQLLPCLDTGHYHPTESVADKITAILQFVPELILHISRGVRWDSDHIPIQDDQTQDIFHELVRSNTLNRVHIALDYFDASINRIGAYTIGITTAQKALLYALLEPTEKLREYEEEGKYYQRLALLEEQKSMPIGVIWEHYCLENNVPTGTQLIKEIQQYEEQVLSKRK